MTDKLKLTEAQEILIAARPFVLNAMSGTNGGLLILKRIDDFLNSPKISSGVDPRRIFD